MRVTPTIVAHGLGGADPAIRTLYRAWFNDRVEMQWVHSGAGSISAWRSGSTSCSSPWFFISDPSQVRGCRIDINFDAKVEGAVLGQLLADWGDAPRRDPEYSGCPLALSTPGCVPPPRQVLSVARHSSNSPVKAASADESQVAALSSVRADGAGVRSLLP